MIIMPVETVEINSHQNLEKWVIIFNEQQKVNNVNSNFQIHKEDIYRTKTFLFLSVEKKPLFNLGQKLKKSVQKSLELWGFYNVNFYPHRFQIVTCIIGIKTSFINKMMLVTL
jgi:hypothetical protein